MKHPNEKRFEDFFVEDRYVVLKNYLYNYLLRKRAINAVLDAEDPTLILEVGSGLSPIVTRRDHVVYSELSFRAIQTLKRHHGRGEYVVADCTRLPFKEQTFSHAVCSEVLEHIEDDVEAMRELSRIIKPWGGICITVPHGKFYFAADDEYVRHFRRYTVSEMEEKLAEAGLKARCIGKVLGPLEKITMYVGVMVFSIIQNRATGTADSRWTHSLFVRIFKRSNQFYTLLARLDAFVMPRWLSTVLLFETEKSRPD